MCLYIILLNAIRPGQQSASEYHASYTSRFEEEGEVSDTQETVWCARHSEFQGRVALADRGQLPLQSLFFATGPLFLRKCPLVFLYIFKLS